MFNLNSFLNPSIEKIAVKFFQKTNYGNIIVQFPSNKVLNFNGKNKGTNAHIKLNNFLLIKKI